MLFAFDGTWNMDKPGADVDTNVVWFRNAYQQQVFYWPGVGTRFDIAGRVVGGITGAGGHTRVHEALQSLNQALDAGHESEIDVVGFSRGAALALDFANRVSELPTSPQIRFLGIWDCVPSFGVANIDLDPTWELELPDNVTKCYHALSLDERRQTFHLHRLNARVDNANQEGRLFEVWFRGVHSDVGGGNKNPGLSSIALNWMLRKAKTCNLPIDATTVQTNAGRMKPGCDISPAPWYDIIKQRFRVVRWNDQVHSSVSFNADSHKCNNPPAGASIVDDDGKEIGKFKRD
jgi:uncharacterized protein (DUF2235 family)